MARPARIRRIALTAALAVALVSPGAAVALDQRPDQAAEQHAARDQAMTDAAELSSIEPVPTRDAAVVADALPALASAVAGTAEWPQTEEVALGLDASTADGAVVDLAWADEAAASALAAAQGVQAYWGTATNGFNPTPGLAAGRVRVEMRDRDAASSLGLTGVVFALDSTEQLADLPIDLALDYRSFAGAFGGDWSSRLRLVRLPACALTDPGTAECRTATPVSSVNNSGVGTVTGTVVPREAPVIALVAGRSGAVGDWAVPAASASTSTVTAAQTGDFRWSYPLRVPPVSVGPEPELALDYSAGSVDARVPGSNPQTSWVGEGWSLDPGYIQRAYTPCVEDLDGATNNAGSATGELCWSGERLTLVFDGTSTELIQDAGTGAWRAAADEGYRIDRLTGATNGDNDGEYWRLTTLDGTQYVFGRGQRSTDDPTALGSAWTVPVIGNHPGEPCYAPDPAQSSCTQAWRWNLDYVVDTSGNSATYFYDAEVNRYGAGIEYIRGGHLRRIDYGQRTGTEAVDPAPARVDFTVADRCLPGVDCTPDGPTAQSAPAWPDVPVDLICTGADCGADGPSFFSLQRLTTVSTQVWQGDDYRSVDVWSLRQSFPATTDGTSAALWLDGVTHHGAAGDAITLRETVFRGVRMANRVDATAAPAISRLRLSAINSETGGTTRITYSGPGCAVGQLPTAPDANTRRCFPVSHQGTGPRMQEYFHKYVVTAVTEDPNDGSSPQVQTRYRYVGDPAWHLGSTPGIDRTWNDFRGYSAVDVLTGDASEQRSHVRTRFFRGMDGDPLAAGGTRRVSVDGIADSDRLAGFVRETITYNGVDGPEVDGTRTTPWMSAATATTADGRTAALVRAGTVEQRVTAPALPGGSRTTRIVTEYDPSSGVPVQVDDQGAVDTPTDDRCTRIEYAQNPSAHLVLTQRTSTVAVSCGTEPSLPDDVIEDQRTFFDGGAFGAEPTRGLPTSEQVVAGYSGALPIYSTTSTSGYDDLGRVIRSTDAMGQESSTEYTGTGAVLTGTRVTGPDPDGSGPGEPGVTSTTVDPAWGLELSRTESDGTLTTTTRDALGRPTAQWEPGRTQGSQSATTTYEYPSPNAVLTRSLTADGGYLASVELTDGLGRPRQTQRPSLNRETAGRVLTDHLYDSRGALVRVNGEWFADGEVTAQLLMPTEHVPGATRYLYDGAGRLTAEITDLWDREQWRTTTSYGGDRVTVDPPQGGVARTTLTDARGQVTELREYLSGNPTGTYRSTSYGYDPAGRATSVQDAGGHTWSAAYDLRGRQIAVTDPDTGTTTTSFDDSGLERSSTDARGSTLVTVRDRLGREIELREDSATGTLRASWEYDDRTGLLTASTRYEGENAYVTAVTGYDAAARPRGVSVTVPEVEGPLAGTYTTGYTYTADGRIRSMSLPAAGLLTPETVTTHYDDLSQPEWMTAGVGWGLYVAGTRYDVYGDLLMYDLGNTASYQVSLDYQEGTRRLIRTWLTRQNINGYAVDLSYGYDPAGNPTSVVDRSTGRAVDAQCFRYDGLGRMTSAWTPANANCAVAPSVGALGGPAPYWTDYTLDAVDNRTVENRHSAGTRTSTYQPGTNRLATLTGGVEASFGYDESGNTAARTVAGVEQQLDWDAEGRLASVTEGSDTVMSALYDAEGDRLIRREGGTTTLYLPGGQEVRLEESTGTVSAMRYYSFDGRPVAMRTGKSRTTVSSLVADPQGGVELAINNADQVVTRRWFDPDGVARGPVPSWTGDHDLRGGVLDDTGLIWAEDRAYDPVTARFLDPDTSVASPYGRQTGPAQWPWPGIADPHATFSG